MQGNRHMTSPIETGTVVETTAEIITQTAEEAEKLLHDVLQSGSVDPVDYVVAIGRLLPLLATIKMESVSIERICETEQIRRNRRRGTKK